MLNVVDCLLLLNDPLSIHFLEGMVLADQESTVHWSPVTGHDS
jgi:hypothetical protein